MKVDYKLASGGAYATLFDEGVAGSILLDEFHPSFSAVRDEAQLYQKNAQFRELRGNVACRLPMRFNIQYGTLAEAMASIDTVGALKKVKIHLRVTQGATVHYYPNATADSYAANLKGVACEHQFQFTSDDLTTTEPT